MENDNTTLFNRRWHYAGATKTTEGFKILTYNILADCAIRRNAGYDKYVPAEYKYMKYRHPLIVKEIQVYQPSVICFQEVEKDHFDIRLNPSMEALGYSGVFGQRGDVLGQATFFKKDLFRLESDSTVLLADVFTEQIKMACENEMQSDIVHMSLCRPNIVLLTKLKHLATGNFLNVGNIHTLWSHPEDNKHTSLVTLQVSGALTSLINFSDNQPFILCGDFNSIPASPAYGLLSASELSDSLLKKCQLDPPLVWDNKSFHLTDLLASCYRNVSRKPKSAYKEVMGSEPPITNSDHACQADLFADCLDYIWYSDDLVPTGVLEPPTNEAISLHYSLPSVVFPSDHISLMAGFTFNCE